MQSLSSDQKIRDRQSIDELLHMARTHLDMPFAFIIEVANDRMTLRHVDGTRPLPLGPGDYLPADESYCQRVIDGRLPEVIPAANDLPEACALGITQMVGIGAYLSVPVKFTDGSSFGTICCFSDSPDVTLNQRDASFLRMAKAVAELLEREHVERAEKAKIVGRINQVISNNALKIAYQPIVDLADKRVVGHEALSRFDTQPYRTPDVWFTDAHFAGMGIDLELTAARRALEALDHFSGYLALNFSAETVLSAGIASLMHSTPVRRIVLELSEHDAIADYDLVASSLKELRDNGMRLAVDDAGAGFASLHHIVQLAPDIIKIDISLVRGIAGDRARQAMAAALVGFAHQTDAVIVAEGIETDADLLAVQRIGASTARAIFSVIQRP